MKMLIGILLLLALGSLSAPASTKYCPSGSACFCLEQSAPVCSTNYCTYDNICRLNCAGQVKQYDGRCGYPTRY